MFEFTELGVVMFFCGLIYMLLVGVRLIPSRRTAEKLTDDFEMDNYLAEIVLLPEEKSVGKKVMESPLVKDLDLDILEVIRGDRKIWVTADSILQAGDLLRVRASAKQIRDFPQRKGIQLKPDRHITDTELESSLVTLVEAVVAPNSWLIGKSLKEIDFRRQMNATALAIRHHGELIREKIADRKLRPGDVLLIEAKVDRLNELKRNSAFVFMSEIGFEEFRKKKILPALLILSAVVAAAALGYLPIVVAAVSGCILMVLFRCITPQEAYDSIDWRVLILLAGTLALGAAMEKTGAATLFSKALVASIGRLGPVVLLSAFYLATSLLTEIMSNNATAVVMCPIAIAAAESMGVQVRPFLMAIAFAASASFMTPIGYQTNTLIYGPGRYRFSDFTRVGVPLNILYWILATILIPRFWPL
jgi:di/tricarboxylate transporter